MDIQRLTPKISIYALYESLTDDTKSSLKGIFKNDSFAGFMACGVQDKNIHSLWDYTQNEVIENGNEDIEKLVKIFDFFFLRYTMAYPIYALQDVKMGADFNADFYIRDGDSSPSGTIKKVLLKGWINTKTDAIVRKSVVSL